MKYLTFLMLVLCEDDRCMTKFVGKQPFELLVLCEDDRFIVTFVWKQPFHNIRLLSFVSRHYKVDLHKWLS